MSNGKPELADLLLRAFRNKLGEVNVAVPGIVDRYDPAEQRADVRPTIRRVYSDGERLDPPVIVDVPVLWPRSGGASLTFPVRRGDPVLLVVCDRSIERWLTQGGELRSPGDPRRHSLDDAVAVPGLVPFSELDPAPPADDVLLRFSGNELRLSPDGRTILETSDELTLAAATQVTIRVGGSTITVTKDGIDVDTTGNVTVSGMSINLN